MAFSGCYPLRYIDKNNQPRLADALERAAHGWWAALVLRLRTYTGVCPYKGAYYLNTLLHSRALGVIYRAVGEE